MYGSGAAIGMGRIAHQAKTTLRARVRVNTACCVVVVGATVRGTAVLRIVAAILLRTVTTTTDSVWCVFHSLIMPFADGEQVKRRRPASDANGTIFLDYAN